MNEFVFKDKLMTDQKEHLLFRAFVLMIGILFVALYILSMLVFAVIERIQAFEVTRNTVAITVRGVSMSPTVEDGAVINATSIFEIDYGSIVVIEHDDGSLSVKTVVAREGDRVERRDSIIRVYKMTRAPSALSGIADMLAYRPQPYYTIVTDFTGNFDYAGNMTDYLKKGQLFVMGDNYNHSTDSTESSVGLIDVSQIRYKVLGHQSVYYDRLH